MTQIDAKELCLTLINADTEEEVIQCLEGAGLWADSSAWRDYGGIENNFSTIGNQQSRPDAALVEKVVNSIDARLMERCRSNGIDPEGPNAPQTMTEAVARFFGESKNTSIAGELGEWAPRKRLAEAQLITIAATGRTPSEGNPSYSIADQGEGQTPENFPDTFLSLNRSNKLRIPFVQGKFNMGGTGVLKFCGKKNLQLIVSRRNPSFLTSHGPTDSHWGFTVVRRVDPSGTRKSSVYKYLAPGGQVLSFPADELRIFPDRNVPYARDSKWGTLVKLYEYSIPRHGGHILRKDGLLSLLDLLLPNVALPIRLYECRNRYRGDAGSYATTLTGVSVRLEDDRGNNMEEGFPSSVQFVAGGESMTATVYAFKKGKAETYRDKEGVLFVIQGQAHGHLKTDFFRRAKIGLGYVADSILVVVDCSRFSGRAREDLFMNSRDRLSSGPLRQEIERSLEQAIREHPGLRALSEQRRREEVQERIADSKPLENVLRDLLKRSPWLSNLFLAGNRATNPQKPISVKPTQAKFVGKRFPTYFRFRDKDYGKVLSREAQEGHSCRIALVTDAVNDYFSRKVDPGDFRLEMEQEGLFRTMEVDHSIILHDGHAHLSFELPPSCRRGSRHTFVATVVDPVRIEAFVNRIEVDVVKAAETQTKGGKGHKRHGGKDDRKHGAEDGGPAGIQLPNITQVRESEWAEKSPPFDRFTALRVVPNGETSSAGVLSYDFFVNVDNIHLLNEIKSHQGDAELLTAKFTFGMVLLGMAALYEDVRPKRDDETRDAAAAADGEGTRVEEFIEMMTRALAPVVLPMIDSLGSLSLESARHLRVSGEAV